MSPKNQTTPERVIPGKIYRGIMPWSEVCLHLGVAGKVMLFEVRPDGQMVQLYHPGSTPLRPFSFPITLGEASVFSDAEGLYHYAPEHGEEVPR